MSIRRSSSYWMGLRWHRFTALLDMIYYLFDDGRVFEPDDDEQGRINAVGAGSAGAAKSRGCSMMWVVPSRAGSIRTRTV